VSIAEETSALSEYPFFPVGAFIEPTPDEHGRARLLTPDDLPALFAERLERHEAAQPGYSDLWAEISSRLLAIDGRGTWVEDYVNVAIPHLFTSGELVPRDVVIVQGPGRPNECHRSVMALAESGRARYVVRGYALDPESGYWLSHTWGASARGELIETTTPKWDRYYGAPWLYRDESSFERERRAAAKRDRRAERNRRPSVKGN